MKKVLILGTNAGQADIIRYLKTVGWEVHSCGYKNEGIGVFLADQFHLVNIIDADRVSELAKKINADLVYSVSSDLAIKTVTKVSEALSLPHYLNSEIVELFDKKEKLRKYLNANNISTVNYVTVNTIEQIHDWKTIPCVVKPTNSQGQRGVRLVERIEDLEPAIKNALAQSSSHSAIIEEYFEGIEISTNVFVQNCNIVVNEFTERYVHGKKYFGLPKGHGLPVKNVDNQNIKRAEEIVNRMISSLKIENAVLYIQMVVTESGPRIIEVAPRLDGCHIWRLIKHARGYDLREYAIKGLLGEHVSHTPLCNGSFSLYFHQTDAQKFYQEDFRVPDNAIFNEYRYDNDENIVPINKTLEVVGYYIKQDD